MIAQVLLALCAVAQAPDDVDAFHTFCDDVAAESGVPLAFVPAARRGGISHVRVGTPGGPEVALLPASLRGPDPLTAAFTTDVREVCRAIASDDALRPVLGEAAILIPVDMGDDAGRVMPAGVDADANFPVRWLESRALHGSRAGAYPGAVGRVGRLSDWLLDRRACAAVVLARRVGAGSDSPRLDARAPGSLTAFCTERLGVHVRACDVTAESRSAELVASVASLPRLDLRDVRWQRLGVSSWAADVQVVNVGATATSHALHARIRRPRGVTLGVSLRSPGVLWSSTAIAEDELESLLVVDTTPGRVALPDLAPGRSVRVRLFFTGDPAGDATTPILDLEAMSPRALGAAAMRLSP